jgi:hypothetical protein
MPIPAAKAKMTSPEVCAWKEKREEFKNKFEQIFRTRA